MCLGWFLWVFISRRSRVNRPPSLDTVSILPFCFSIDLLCVFSAVRRGGIKHNRLQVNVVKGQFLTQPWTERRINSWCCTWAQANEWFPGLEDYFFQSFPLSWEHAALWTLSSDVVLDFCQVKRFIKKKMLCCIFCVSFLLSGLRVTVPRELTQYGTNGESLGCCSCPENEFCFVFQR